MMVLRFLAHTGKFHPLYFFFRLLYIRMKYKYGYQIPIRTKIGQRFFIGHFGNIIVNSAAVFGSNCNIAHGVTIGKTNRGSMMGCPLLATGFGLAQRGYRRKDHNR
jgi:serine O-acetyltransferase